MRHSLSLWGKGLTNKWFIAQWFFPYGKFRCSNSNQQKEIMKVKFPKNELPVHINMR
jgi:hypothetical protein